MIHKHSLANNKKNNHFLVPFLIVLLINKHFKEYQISNVIMYPQKEKKNYSKDKKNNNKKKYI